MDIGENGHIAFNDHHVASFDDDKMVKIIELDKECRKQQVNDGYIGFIEEVPTHAITLTIPTLMRGNFLFCVVPGDSKAKAVKNTIKGEISESCPATIIRSNASAI